MSRLHAQRIRWHAVALLATSLSLLVTCIVLCGVMHPMWALDPSLRD